MDVVASKSPSEGVSAESTRLYSMLFFTYGLVLSILNREGKSRFFFFFSYDLNFLFPTFNRLFMMVITFDYWDKEFANQNYFDEINYNFAETALDKVINHVETKSLGS